VVESRSTPAQTKEREGHRRKEKVPTYGSTMSAIAEKEKKRDGREVSCCMKAFPRSVTILLGTPN
jgi:hypothetical protein